MCRQSRIISRLMPRLASESLDEFTGCHVWTRFHPQNPKVHVRNFVAKFPHRVLMHVAVLTIWWMVADLAQLVCTALRRVVRNVCIRGTRHLVQKMCIGWVK